MKLILIFLLSVITPVKDSATHLGVYNEILEQGLEFPDIVFAQAVLESGGFTSRLTQKNNNIFGMRNPMKRTTTSVGSYHGYAIYESWRESIEDYYLFQKMLFSTHKFTRASYLNYLDKYYSTSKGYKTALLKIIKNHKILLYPPPSDRNDGSLNNSFVIP
jgi:uncharacterized FlgJ-related protein